MQHYSIKFLAGIYNYTSIYNIQGMTFLHSCVIFFLLSEQKDGPLSFLRDAMANKKVVNVWIRHSAGLRGVCTGKIRAFDKHWNIVSSG